MSVNRSPDPAQSLRLISDQLTTALQRVEALVPRLAAPDSGDTREALLFNLERSAWAAIELANLWVLQKRIGMPRKETESFDLLAKAGLIPIDLARRLRYATESRNLSHRNAGLLDWEHFEKGLAPDIAILRQWQRQVEDELTRSAPGGA